MFNVLHDVEELFDAVLRSFLEQAKPIPIWIEPGGLSTARKVQGVKGLQAVSDA